MKTSREDVPLTKEQLAGVKITVLEQNGTWLDSGDGRTLANALHLYVGIFGDRRFPRIMMVQGEWSRDKIATILGRDNFTLKIVQGAENPELPFKPPVIIQ